MKIVVGQTSSGREVSEKGVPDVKCIIPLQGGKNWAGEKAAGKNWAFRKVADIFPASPMGFSRAALTPPSTASSVGT